MKGQEILVTNSDLVVKQEEKYVKLFVIFKDKKYGTKYVIFTDNDNNTEIETTNKAGSQIKIDNNNSLDDIVLDFMVNLA